MSSSSTVPRQQQGKHNEYDAEMGASTPTDDITKLRTAIVQKQTQRLHDLIQSGIDLNVIFLTEAQESVTPLQYAIKFFKERKYHPEERYRIIQLLMEAPDIDINKTNKLGQTALMVAVTYEDVELVQYILAHPRINVNVQNYRGETALMYAYILNNRDIIHLLQTNGADLNIKDEKGRTVEWFKKRENVVEYLKTVRELEEYKHMAAAVKILTSLKTKKGGKKKRTNKRKKSRKSFTRSIMRLFSK